MTVRPSKTCTPPVVGFDGYIIYFTQMGNVIIPAWAIDRIAAEVGDFSCRVAESFPL